jgi:hypothetical protein
MYKQIAEGAVQSLANQVEVIQTDPIGEVVVQIIDGLIANSSDASKVALRHAPFAKAR